MSKSDVLQQVEKMFTKTEGKLFEAETAIRIVKKKWPEKYGPDATGLDFSWDDMQSVVQAKLDSLLAAKNKADTKKESSSDDDDSSDESDSGSDSDEEAESGSESESDEEEESMSSESSSTDGSEDKHDRPGAEDVPATKKQRTEEGAVTTSTGGPELGPKCDEMHTFLKKLRVKETRKRNEDESVAEYYNQFLLPIFHKNGLDPSKLDKAAAKKYQMKKELNDLMEDGLAHGVAADLDPKHRTGRAGWGGYEAPAGAVIQQPSFIDDD